MSPENAVAETGPTGALLYTVVDAARMLNLSRSVIFDQLRTGRLGSVKQGRRRLIPAIAMREYVELLIREARDAA